MNEGASTQTAFQLDEFYLDLNPDGQISFLQKAEINKKPFPGLRPFKTSEFQLFHGRDGQAEQLVSRLKKNRFLAVIGSSGTGKSSLIRAGLLPQLYAGYLYESGTDWDTAICRPGKNPIENLSFALARIKSKSNEQEKIIAEHNVIEPLLSSTVYGLLEVNDLLYSNAQPNTKKRNLLIIIDQFEELFRFNREEIGKPGIEIQFVNLLLKAAENRGSSIYVIITMRSEFLGDAVKYRGLPEAINEGQYLVPQLSREQIKEVIEEPVKLAGKQIAPGLVDLLVNEIEESKAKKDLDQLPVLQHALMRTFQEAVKNPDVVTIEYEHYKACGGMEKALANHAEGIYMQLGDGKKDESFKQRIAKIIFQALTEISSGQKGGRRPTQLKLLYEIAASINAGEKEVDEVINHFRDEDTSFIMPPPNTDLHPGLMIDISHESLIRQWSRLNEWVAEEAEYAKTFVRLAESQQLHGQGIKDMLTKKELAPISKWYYSFKPQSTWAGRYVKNYKESFDYLLQSEKAWKQKRNFTRLAVAGLFIAICLVVFMTANLKAKQKAALNKQQYLNSSRVAMLQGDLLTASLFMAEAISVAQPIDSILNNSNTYLPYYYLSGIYENKADIQDGSFSKGSDSLILQGQNSFYTWNIKTGQTDSIKDYPGFESYYLQRQEEYVYALQNLLKQWGVDTIVDGNGLGKILDNEFGVVLKIPKNIQSFGRGSAHPKAQLCLTMGESAESLSNVYIWNMKNGEQLGPSLLHPAYIADCIFNEDASKVATWDENNLIRLFKKVGIKQFDHGDRDIDPSLFKMQMEVVTGARLNEQKTSVVSVPVNDWRELYKTWMSRAEEHYKNCNYKDDNYWKHCFNN
jgi:energy-coupling factor transporter ATP-binding protein EcfA2